MGMFLEMTSSFHFTISNDDWIKEKLLKHISVYFREITGFFLDNYILLICCSFMKPTFFFLI